MDLRASRFLSLLALAPLALACARTSPAAEVQDAAIDAAQPGHAADASVFVLLPDAGQETLAAADAQLQAAFPNNPLRLSLIADLGSDELLGLRPGEPGVKLEEKLGPPLEKQGEVWRWPTLGVEAVVREGRIARIALHAVHRLSDPDMRMFVGQVLAGGKALTAQVQQLKVQEIGPLLGEAQAKRRIGADVLEQAWLRGKSTLYLTFDKASQELEAIVLEPTDAATWDAMTPVVPPERAPASTGPIEFAQVPPALDAAAAAKLRVVAQGRPDARAMFAAVESRFLRQGDALVRLDGRRAAMLRAGGCAYLALEEKKGTWALRNPNAPCAPDAEAAGAKQLEAELGRTR